MMWARLGAALDALVSAGANQMNGISFSIQRSRAAAGTGPHRCRGRCPRPGRDLCQGGRRDAGADPVHQRRRRRGARPMSAWPPMMAGSGRVRWRRAKKASPPMSPWCGKSTEGRLYWAHDQSRFSKTGPRRSAPRRWTGSGRSISRRPMTAPWPNIRPRSRPSRRTPPPPSFDNVVLALEKSGRLLARVDSVFSNLASSATNDALQAIELEMAPRLSAHWSAIYHASGAVCAAGCAVSAARRRWGWTPKACGCWNAITWISCAPARS